MYAAKSFQPAPSGPLFGTDMGCAYQVSLIDRRTGRAHRVSGRPVTRFTRDPQSATVELLAGRDPHLWETRVEPLDPFAQ